MLEPDYTVNAENYITMPADSLLFQPGRARVVATISSLAGWRAALEINSASADSPDFLEVRADLLLENVAELPGDLAQLPLPVILTVRGPLEGGKGAAAATVRAAIYERYLAKITALDVELAEVEKMGALIDRARSRNVACVFSSHHFADMPQVEELARMAARAHCLGANLLKVAVATDSLAQLCALLTWFEMEKCLPLAAMGMGRFGKISRPLLAQLGSQLNYGYLDAPVVAGQWPARELQRIIRSLT